MGFGSHSNQQYGCNTTSNDYMEYITNIERMPSGVFHIPSAQRSLDDKVFDEIKREFERNQEAHDPHHANHHKHHAPPEVQKKVHFVEKERIIETDQKGERRQFAKERDINMEKRIIEKDQKGEQRQFAKERDINMEADGFIKKKHKNFEQFKWH